MEITAIVHVNKKKPKQLENQTDAFLAFSENEFFNKEVETKDKKQIVKCYTCGKEVELEDAQIFKSRPEQESVGRHRFKLTRYIEAYCPGVRAAPRTQELDGIALDGCTDKEAVQLRKDMRKLDDTIKE